MSIHKAFILGAGKGTRLQPLTDYLPKPLVPVFNRPMVEQVLDHCIEHGITSFMVNTHHLAHQWAEYFPTNEYKGCSIEFTHEEVLLETGGGLRNIQPWIGDDSVLAYNADIWTDLNLSKLISEHTSNQALATLALRSEGSSQVISFEPQSSQVLDIRNHFNEAKGTHQFTGVYTISPALIDLIPEETKVSVIPAFLKAIEQQKLKACVFDEATWVDIGTPEMYLQLHNHPVALKKNKNTSTVHPSAKIHPTATVDTRSFIGKNAIVGANSTIINSVIWHNTCIREDSHLQDSLLCSPEPVGGELKKQIL